VNWKNVIALIGADTKSYRLASGKRFRRFRESKIVTFGLYVGALLLGPLVGWLIGDLYSDILDPQMKALFLEGAISFFMSFPTVALLYGLVLTQMSQFRRIGAKVSVEPLYWFPITWEEHTLASITANILGVPLAFTVFVASAITVASVFMGVVPLAFLTIFALLSSVFMASATTEISKVLQVRVSGAVTKAAGRAAIWLRLIGSILFLLVFYAVYFSLYFQTNSLVLLEMIATGQKSVWFIPYVWPGIALSYLALGLPLEATIFSVALIAFMYVLFLVAAKLNVRYGLYEMPAIRISRGVYLPKTGFLGRLGFSPSEAAMMRKDFKAFTRRQELAYIFITPVIIAIMPLLSFSMTSARTEAPPPEALRALFFATSAVLPGTIMGLTLGSMIIGLEGAPVWYVYSSPITAKSLVKAKYSFSVLFSLAATSICSGISGAIWPPSVTVGILCLVEAVFLTSSLSMVSLSFGIKGADFREIPRPRMIRPKWMLINGLVCIVLAAAILSPIIPYALDFFLKAIGSPITVPLPIPEAYLYFALPISGAIAYAVVRVFHGSALRNAESFLVNAEEQYGSLVLPS